MVFYHTRGGEGSERVVKKPYCFFEEEEKSIFFQIACRIILGPPKHVLHLVWSPFVKYTANKTALKVALYDFRDFKFVSASPRQI